MDDELAKILISFLCIVSQLNINSNKYKTNHLIEINKIIINLK